MQPRRGCLLTCYVIAAVLHRAVLIFFSILGTLHETMCALCLVLGLSALPLTVDSPEPWGLSSPKRKCRKGKRLLSAARFATGDACTAVVEVNCEETWLQTFQCDGVTILVSLQHRHPPYPVRYRRRWPTSADKQCSCTQHNLQHVFCLYFFDTNRWCTESHAGQQQGLRVHRPCLWPGHTSFASALLCSQAASTSSLISAQSCQCRDVVCVTEFSTGSQQAGVSSPARNASAAG